MTISWYAIDHTKKVYFFPPGNFSDYARGLFHPENPFPHMLVMKNYFGHAFELENDCGFYIPDGYKEITDQVYKEYLQAWPQSNQESVDI